jgi:hypothetical protein
MAAEGLKYAYKKISDFLRLSELAPMGVGLTVIVTPVWMFVGILSEPYHVEPATELPLYLDGFAYAGIYNLQSIKQVWPATAGLSYRKYRALESLHK